MAVILQHMLRLITIPISHYCEKARWALDRAGLDYREERHVQIVHRVVARRAGGGNTVPVLVTEDRVIGESEEIITWVDGHLTPEQRLVPASPGDGAEVLRVSRRFDGDFGVRGRRLIYVHMLDASRELALEVNNQGVPGGEDERIVWQELDFAAGQLSRNGPYLCGKRFTAADLTFAALAAPVIAPPGYGVALPQPDALPAATADLICRAREHPAGADALKMFEDHRRERSA